MLGLTVKSVGAYKTETGVVVFLEEYPVSCSSVTAAPVGVPDRRIEIGVFDAATAEAVLDGLYRRFPAGMATPPVTDGDVLQARLALLSATF